MNLTERLTKILEDNLSEISINEIILSEHVDKRYIKISYTFKNELDLFYLSLSKDEYNDIGVFSGDIIAAICIQFTKWIYSSHRRYVH